MIKFFKRLFCLIGNYLPPKFNCYFYKLAGVKFNINKVWIGNKCYLDSMFPENIIINDNVCISCGVTIIAHFDPTESINKHLINRYKKNVIIQSGTFVGPSSIIMPGVVIKKNSFIKAGSVITKSTKINSIICGNPQKEIGFLNKKNSSKINKLNKKYKF